MIVIPKTISRVFAVVLAASLALIGGALAPAAEPPAPCAERVPLFAAGKPAAAVCREAAAAQGLTLINLSDDWRPLVLTDDPVLGEAGAQPYAATYLALASGRFGKGPEWDEARDDRYLELYGIFPSLSQMRARISDEERHHCHQQVTAVSSAAGAPRRAAILLAQQHLRCEGLLGSRYRPGTLDARTTEALELFQRQQMIVSSTGRPLDAEVQAALFTDSTELDLRALLRVLRERVADAAGLVEDGSAQGQWGQVAGRDLDAAAFRTLPGGAVAGEGAPDLIAQATDAAAQALGWTSPQGASAFFARMGATLPAPFWVAVKLPPAPAYHSDAMDLRAELDRGDVWYDFPYGSSGREIAQPVTRHPTLTLYAKDPVSGHEIALLRWATTIGGWQVDKLPGGGLRYQYKDSDVGPLIVRDVVATPAWLPPESTPDKELVRRSSTGKWISRQDATGPGYRSAYGLVMMVHDELERSTGGALRYEDKGIRTHGSANYRSIVRGYSHGCHRLFNHLAVRLTSFLLRHRKHVRHGVMRADYERVLRWRGQTLALRLASRGYRYELTPPLAMDVLAGTIRGEATRPLTRLVPLPPGKRREYLGLPATPGPPR